MDMVVHSVDGEAELCRASLAWELSRRVDPSSDTQGERFCKGWTGAFVRRAHRPIQPWPRVEGGVCEAEGGLRAASVRLLHTRRRRGLHRPHRRPVPCNVMRARRAHLVMPVTFVETRLVVLLAFDGVSLLDL